jgi:hypothetical protein
MTAFTTLLAIFIGVFRLYVHHGDAIGQTAFFSYMALAHFFVAYLWFKLIGGGLRPITQVWALITRDPAAPTHEWHIDALIVFWILVIIEVVCTGFLKI